MASTALLLPRPRWGSQQPYQARGAPGFGPHRRSGGPSQGVVAIVGIRANDPAAYPEDASEGLAEQARRSVGFPYLFGTQEVAKACTAAGTPDPFRSTRSGSSSTGASSTRAARATGSP